MKNFFKMLCIVFASILVMPVFAACNGQGATETLSVRFASSVYEVECNVPTKIDYQIYPSTATNNRIVFTFAMPENSYEFDDSKYVFTLKDPSITDDIEATITVNNSFTDTCIIRQKMYPNLIYFDETSGSVNSGAVYGLQLKGLFSGTEQVLNPSKYDLEIESSNPSVLRVEGLNVVSTGKLGSAKISAKVKDANGNYVVEDPTLPDASQVILYAELNLTVVPNAERAIVSFQGQNEFISVSKNSYEMVTSNKYITNLASAKVVIELYSADGYLIDDTSAQINMISVDSSLATVQRDSVQNNKFTITFALPTDDTLHYARFEITTAATDADGNPVKFIFYAAREVV